MFCYSIFVLTSHQLKIESVFDLMFTITNVNIALKCMKIAFDYQASLLYCPTVRTVGILL